jgi:hypothetical protein
VVDPLILKLFVRLIANQKEEGEYQEKLLCWVYDVVLKRKEQVYLLTINIGLKDWQQTDS